MKETISTVEYASLLYDFYGELLSEARKDVMNLYHEDNLSLSEIADELGMTRQAVHYTLKKAEAALEQYEEKLGLLARYKENQVKSKRASDIADKLLADDNLTAEERESVESMMRIIEEITE
ncbi:MAG: MarR family transcriptional regulator [Clostridiales bacterium]|nr:MarR family transcriptional regulator [Candidatus Crickella merdequi]